MTELRILVCDDEPAMLDIMLRRLDKMGIKPDRAEDGAIAQSLIQENDYDLIVTDIYMPEATGLEVLEMAKEKNPQTQVIIVTASATLDNAIDALNQGAYGYLTKPFDHLTVFDNMVSRALEFRRLLLANERMSEAQKRRGDMLEDEVTSRVRQLRLKQKGLIDLLNCLPDGILVVEEGGKLVLTSPKAEEWLARDRRSDEQPIQQFISQVHSEWAEYTQEVQLDGEDLRLIAVDYPNPEGVKRKAILMRDVEEEAIGQGSLVQDTVSEIKQGLAWLFQQDLGSSVKDAVTNLANQLNMLEQLAGLGSGTNGGPPELAPAELPPHLQFDPALDPATGELVEDGSDNGRTAPGTEVGEAGSELPAEPLQEASIEAPEPPARELDGTLVAEPELEPPAEQLGAIDEGDLAQEQPAAPEEDLPIVEPEPSSSTELAEPEGEPEAEIELDQAEPEPAVDLEARLGALEETLVVDRGRDSPPDEAPPEDTAAEPMPEPADLEPQPDSSVAEPESEPEPAEVAAAEDQAAGPVKEPLWRRLAKKAGVSKPLSKPSPEPPDEAAVAEPEEAPATHAEAPVADQDAPTHAPSEEPAPVEADPAQRTEPESMGAAPEPAPTPIAKEQSQPDESATWPPVLPSEDPEFTEELDVSD